MAAYRSTTEPRGYARYRNSSAIKSTGPVRFNFNIRNSSTHRGGMTTLSKPMEK